MIKLISAPSCLRLAAGASMRAAEMAARTPGPRAAKPAGAVAMTALTIARCADPAPESLGQQVRRRQAEAKALARMHPQCLKLALLSADGLAAEIAAGGEAYRPGVRDLARQAAADNGNRARLLQALLVRNRGETPHGQGRRTDASAA